MIKIHNPARLRDRIARQAGPGRRRAGGLLQWRAGNCDLKMAVRGSRHGRLPRGHRWPGRGWAEAAWQQTRGGQPHLEIIINPYTRGGSMSKHRMAAYGAGTALAAVLALMMVPSGSSIAENGPAMYGMAEFTIKNANGDVLSSDTVHNAITNEGEAYLLDTLFNGTRVGAPNVICMTDLPLGTAAEQELLDKSFTYSADFTTPILGENVTGPDVELPALVNFTHTNGTVTNELILAPGAENVTFDFNNNGIIEQGDFVLFPPVINQSAMETDKNPCVSADPISADPQPGQTLTIDTDPIVAFTTTPDASTAEIVSTFFTDSNIDAGTPLMGMLICTDDPAHHPLQVFRTCEEAAGPNGALFSTIPLSGTMVGEGDTIEATYTFNVTSPES
ncbi:hypothetical protein CENSYa_1321 [Cenarchaeum symbiosum A]|uniref:Uncharacterized protein n=1 Tax=Cenarchaeum symbiosum (strain A) TaxID=414004 RepID=A0RX77_CENSY|nr:hypothetical protein CENSYa_1321 [Cenarchaeum symbiosum A]